MQSETFYGLYQKNVRNQLNVKIDKLYLDSISHACFLRSSITHIVKKVSLSKFLCVLDTM